MSSGHLFIDDISNGVENVKISFENTIDMEKPSRNVSYISVCELRSESLAEDFESVHQPCSCMTECVSESRCFCTEGGLAYDGRKLLARYSLPSSKPILECSVLCSCTEACPNRVVQKGVVHPLQVFKTKSKGFGVRTLEAIPELSFVCEYAGEILDQQEAEKRMHSLEPNQSNYIFVLKEHGCGTQKLKTVIDPTRVGNVGRYLNHSCSPNLVVVPVRCDSMVPRLCFFAKRDIKAMEELCYHYSGEQTDDRRGEGLGSVTGMRVCCCESKDCAGFVPLDADWIS